ncbi:MAG: EFR1 family ferrodoxin, partial [Methanobacterium sp.]|nr:EFR1 family ferrodoxin [Methanobacterium sp.]
MATEIYYFSGTGNSLAVARDITEKINGKLIPIASVMYKDSIKSDVEVIGIVFPTYYEPYGGVPLIVRRFIAKLENIDSKYIFAICTYGSISVNALNFLDEILQSRGGKLIAGFTVNMPHNIGSSSLNSPQKQQKMFRVWEENLNIITEHINSRREIQFDTPNVLAGKTHGLIKFIVTPLMFLFKPTTLRHLKRYHDLDNGSYDEMLPYMDRSFYTNDKCTGCGTCTRICPVKNIKLVNEQPEW